MTLRPLKLDDRDQLLHLFSTMSEKALEWGMPPYTKETIDRWMSNFERLIPLVAVYEEHIVAYAAIYKHFHSRQKGIGDMGIYIHQNFHNVGLGTAMAEKTLSMAKEQGLYRVELKVVEDNVAAVALYKKIGFKVEGNLVDAYFGADDKYHNLLIMGILFPEN